MFHEKIFLTVKHFLFLWRLVSVYDVCVSVTFCQNSRLFCKQNDALTQTKCAVWVRNKMYILGAK